MGKKLQLALLTGSNVLYLMNFNNEGMNKLKKVRLDHNAIM